MNALALLKRYKWATLLIVAVFLFYWYEIRPVRIIRACVSNASTDARLLLRNKAAVVTEKKKKAEYEEMIEKGMYLRSDYDSFYHKCLSYYGFLEDPAAQEQ